MPPLGHDVWIGYLGAMWPSSSPSLPIKHMGVFPQPLGVCFHELLQPSKTNILYSPEATPVVLTWGQ